MRQTGTSLVAVDSPTAQASPLAERFAATPRLACEALARALEVRDLEAAMACFTSDACLIAPDGAHVLGEAAIRSRLAQLIGAGTPPAIEPLGVIVAGEVAFAQPSFVLRRLGEEWRIAIAAPWGAPASPPLRAIGMSN
jgi:SnoaL-like protein